MITLEQPVIVEGKYDKIALENVIDALIIPTNGFRIFKDREKCRLIRELAAKHGVIVMTDSDGAGKLIRGYLKQIIGEAEIIQVYLPRVPGKEKRKSHASKEGVLGVEGFSPDELRRALTDCGVFLSEKPRTPAVTKADLFTAGLSGGQNSREARQRFCAFLGWPDNLTTPGLLDIINRVFTAEEWKQKVAEWQNNSDKK